MHALIQKTGFSLDDSCVPRLLLPGWHRVSAPEQERLGCVWKLLQKKSREIPTGHF